MLRHPLYTIYSLFVLGTLSVAQWRGWSLNRINEVKDVPKTVRDNPGAYRSHYGYIPGRYIGGK
jgi:hypothetical protein